MKTLFTFILAFALSGTMLMAQVIDVIGTGVQLNETSSLDVGPVLNIDKVVVYVIYYDYAVYNGTDEVIFSTSATSVNVTGLSGPTNIDDFDNTVGDWVEDHKVAYFTWEFSNQDLGTGIIEFDQNDLWINATDGGRAHSFVAYIYRTIPEATYYSMVEQAMKHAFIFRNGASDEVTCDPYGPNYQEPFPIDPPGPKEVLFDIGTSNSPRDISIIMPVTDMTQDCRTGFIEIFDNNGTSLAIQEFSTYNLNKSLYINPIDISDVDGSVNQIVIKVWSPCDDFFYCGGDSFITSPILMNVEKEDEEPPGEYCTLTQGFYGNPGGKFNGYTTEELLDMLLATPLEIGSDPGYMFVIHDAQCVLDRLPGGGKDAALTADDLLDCTSNGYKTHKDGRIKNALLAQTITMGLNLRLDANLGDLALGDLFFWDYSGFSETTIQELYDMANLVLGGGSTSYNLGDITEALGAINDFFDECAELIEPETLTTIGKSFDNETAIAIYPNPVSGFSSVEFTPAQSDFTSVELYNLMGSRVQTLYTGYTESGHSYSMTLDGNTLQAGVYILVLRNGEQTSRTKISIK